MNKGLSNRQIFALILLSLQGIPVIALPHDMAASAGTGAWFTLTLATLVFFIPVVMLTTLNRMFPGKTLYQYSELLVGKFLSVVLAVLYAAYFLVLFAFVARSASEVIKADVLPLTPKNVILFVFIATSLYVTSRGLTNIGRIVETAIFLLLPLIIFLHTLMFTQGDIYNLLPVYNPSKTICYFKALPVTLPAFVGYEALAVVPFQANNLRLGRRYALGGIVAAGAVYILVTESCYSILGLADIVNYNDALVVAIRRIDAPYLEIFRRVDLIFLVAWMTAILMTLNIYSFGVHQIACDLFPKLKQWVLLVIAGTAAFAIAAFPSCAEDSTKYFNTFLYAVAPLTGILAPGLLLIMTRIRKHVVPKSN